MLIASDSINLWNSFQMPVPVIKSLFWFLLTRAGILKCQSGFLSTGTGIPAKTGIPVLNPVPVVPYMKGRIRLKFCMHCKLNLSYMYIYSASHIQYLCFVSSKCYQNISDSLLEHFRKMMLGKEEKSGEGKERVFCICFKVCCSAAILVHKIVFIFSIRVKVLFQFIK